MAQAGQKGDRYDVIVVGAGNAAFAAALSARDNGAQSVAVLEKADKAARGGNTRFSGGLFRFAYDSVDQILAVCPEAKNLDGFMEGIEPYPAAAFRADLDRMTGGRSDKELSEVLISNSYDTVAWMVKLGHHLEPAVSLGGVVVDGKIKWPKGAVIRTVHEGVGLSESWFRIAEQHKVEILYEHGATALIQDDNGRVIGVRVKTPHGIKELMAGGVVLACGGFEANSAMRGQYLGKPWDHAKVRGTRHNQGDGIRMAVEAGALPVGQYTGCHATPISADAPEYGIIELTDKTNRLSYPYGVMINRDGVRFIDEAPDFQFFTYAKYGGVILNQPGGVAYQIFDQKVVHLLEKRYNTSVPITADSLDALIDKLPVNRDIAKQTLRDYNAAAGHGAFNPGILDNMHTKGLQPPKSNWANKLDKPPFVCYPCTGGITFSFGGLKIDTEGRVLDTGWRPIPGLYCAGEMVGNLFHDNYPGGSGLPSGAVFGRIAGRSAARRINT
jgi:tricarballylate dehydrogenase